MIGLVFFFCSTLGSIVLQPHPSSPPIPQVEARISNNGAASNIQLFRSGAPVATWPVPSPGSYVKLMDITENFEGMSVGSPNGQNGWTKTGSYDEVVHALSPGTIPGDAFGTKCFRMSNAGADGAFAGHAFSKPLPEDVGETDGTTTNPAFLPPSGIRHNMFTVEFQFMSASPMLQDSLRVGVSPDNGLGDRMSLIYINDNSADGLHLTAFDYVDASPFGAGPCTPSGMSDGNGVGDDFPQHMVANNLDRSTVYTVRMEIEYIDGPRNDVVRIFLDNTLKLTMTTWEDYFRFNFAEQGCTLKSRISRNLLFRSSAASTCCNGQGVYFDNIKYGAYRSRWFFGADYPFRFKFDEPTGVTSLSIDRDRNAVYDATETVTYTVSKKKRNIPDIVNVDLNLLVCRQFRL
jgi:hypothetical protein